MNKRWIAAKMVNAANPVMTAKTVAKKMARRWTAARMGNAVRKAMMERIAAKHLIRISHYKNR